VKIPVRQAVGSPGGLQAQEPSPPFLGLWTRLAEFQASDLAEALRRKEVVRATYLRGTLHLIDADDYLAFRSSFQPLFTLSMNSILRDRVKNLDVETLAATARQLFQEQPRTFTDMRAALVERFPDVDERALGFTARMQVPLASLPDDSPWSFPTDPIFADASSWLGRSFEPSANLEALAMRYLGAFGPASVTDFQNWSGLKGGRDVFNALRPRLVTYRDDRKRELFDLPDAPRPDESTPAPVRFLPGFDNAILGHDDRSRIIADEHRPRVSTKNLQVLPTFLVDGVVAGTWKTGRTKGTVSLMITPFTAIPAKLKAEVVREAEQVVRFLHPDAGKPSVAIENA
jgi:hypothetical protein